MTIFDYGFTFDANKKVVSCETGHVLSSAQVLASVAHSHLCDYQVAERVEVDSRVGDYTLAVFVP